MYILNGPKQEYINMIDSSILKWTFQFYILKLPGQKQIKIFFWTLDKMFFFSWSSLYAISPKFYDQIFSLVPVSNINIWKHQTQQLK